MYKRLLYKQKKCLQCGLLFSKSFSLHIQTLRKPNYGHFQLFQLLFVCNNLKIRKKIKSLEWNCYQVVAVVEARVVGARKGDHELAGVLVHAVHRNAMSLKKKGKIIILIGLSQPLIKVSVIWSSNIKERKKT